VKLKVLIALAQSLGLAGVFGLRDSGGGVRAGLVHYNDEAEVDRLVAAVAELLPGGVR